MAKFFRKCAQSFTDAVVARKREVKDGLLLAVDTGKKYTGLAVSDLKFTPRNWSPLGAIIHYDYKPKSLLEFIQYEVVYPPKPATLVAEELEAFLVENKVVGLVVSISDPPQEVKDREGYLDGTAHTEAFLEECKDVIGDIPTGLLEEHLTTARGSRDAYNNARKAAYELGYYVVSRAEFDTNPTKVYLDLQSKSRAEKRTIKLMFKEDLARTFLGKQNKDMCAAGQLLDRYMESEKSTFTALFEEDGFTDYFKD